MKGIKRTFFYWTRICGQMTGVLILCAIIYGMFLGLINGEIMGALDMISFYLILFGAIMGGALQVSEVQVYLGQCLSMGAKRRDSFIGMQYTNWLGAVLMYLMALVLQVISGASGQYQWRLDTQSSKVVFGYVAGVLLANGVGNIVSVLSIRFGRAGMVAYMITMAVCGGVMGVMGSLLADGFIPFSNIPKALFLIVPMVVYVVSAVLQYRVVRKFEIRV